MEHDGSGGLISRGKAAVDKDGDAGAGDGTAGGGTDFRWIPDEVFKLKKRYCELFKEFKGIKLGLVRWADEVVQGQGEMSRRWDDLDTKVKALAEQAEGTVQSIGVLAQRDYVVDLARWADEVVQGQAEMSRRWDDLDTKVKALHGRAG